MKEYKVIESTKLSTEWEKRYVIIDSDGNIIDNAQGYGYKSIRNAHAAFHYKNRDKSKDAEKAKKKKLIRSWMKQHKGFVGFMDQIAFEIAKGSWGPDDKFDAKLVKKMLNDQGFTDLPFTPGELLREWRKS